MDQTDYQLLRAIITQETQVWLYFSLLRLFFFLLHKWTSDLIFVEPINNSNRWLVVVANKFKEKKKLLLPFAVEFDSSTIYFILQTSI